MPFYLSILRRNLIYLLLLTGSSAWAQIQIGPSSTTSLNKSGRFSKADLDAFKAHTTVITIPDSELRNKAAWEAEIAKVWTNTPFQIVGLSELSDYASPDFNLFMFSVYQVNNGNSKHTHSTYDLFRVKEKRGRDLYARVFIYPETQKLLQPKPFSIGKASDASSDRALQYFYRHGTLFNFNLPTVKAYLKFINDRLASGEEQGIYSTIGDAKKLSPLKTHTLYLPEYTAESFNKFTGQRKTEPINPQDLKAAYPYKIAYISKEALDQKLLNSEETFYFLSYTQSSTDKYLNVISSTGEILYTDHASMSYNFKEKDLKDLGKVVGKN